MKLTNLDISLPVHASQIRYADFLDFREQENIYFDENQKGEGGTAALAKAVQHIVKYDGLGSLPVGKFEERYLSMGEEPTLGAIYGHICHVINDYRGAQIIANLTDAGVVGDDLKKATSKYGFNITLEEIGGRLIELQTSKNGSAFVCEYKGEKYEMTEANIKSAFGIVPALTVGEVITVEMMRKASSKKAEMKNGDIDAAIEYSLGLDMCAVLLRKPGEVLPANPLALDDFLIRRGEHFKDLPMDTVLNIRFFLIFILKRCVEKVGRGIFSMTLKPDKRTAEKRKASGSTKQKRARKPKR